jgi:hypothetical protein
MLNFKIAFTDYFYDVHNDQEGSFFWKNTASICEIQIKQLIARYDLASNKVLSLVSGLGFEEFWMGESGCELTLVDLDPVEILRNKLSTINPHNLEGIVLNFIIADAIEYCASIEHQDFDILYVSSMHPDEIRREKIQADFIANRTEVSRQSYLTWPKGVRPYSNEVSDGWSLVKDGGLVIMQHYRGGVDSVMQPHYIDDVADQLSEKNLYLLEVWCYRKSPQHLLIIAFKGKENLKQWSANLIKKQLISTFHGRYPDPSISTDVIRIYPLRGK